MILQPYEGIPPIKRFVTGSYIGDDAETQNINLGFPPRAVLTAEQSGRMGFERTSASAKVYGGLTMPGKPVTTEGVIVLEVTGTGFAVHKPSGANGYISTNLSGNIYYYIAFI